MPTRHLYRVVDARFVAGVVADGDRIVETAPILHRYRGGSLAELRRQHSDCRRIVTMQTAHVSHSQGIDVSRMTGDPVFAPSWQILRPALELRRQGRETAETWAQYSAAYLAEMEQSLATHQQRWRDLVAEPEIVLKCYCVAKYLPRCHRVLLARLLSLLGERDVFGAVDVCYLGEVQPVTSKFPRQTTFAI